MKNSKKDEYDHKLYRFVQELNRIPFSPFGEHDAKRTALLKKYGFTKVDEERSYGITRHQSERKYWVNEIGIKKSVQMDREKSLKQMERNLEKQELEPEQ
jgi:hypothetical protein